MSSPTLIRGVVSVGLDGRPEMAQAQGMDLGPLVGLTEIAMRAGVQKPSVSTWRNRGLGFPEPFQVLHTGAVWWWEPVRVWLESTGRQTDASWTLEQVTPKTHRVNKQIQERFNQLFDWADPKMMALAREIAHEAGGPGSWRYDGNEELTRLADQGEALMKEQRQ